MYTRSLNPLAVLKAWRYLESVGDYLGAPVEPRYHEWVESYFWQGVGAKKVADTLAKHLREEEENRLRELARLKVAN